MYMQSCVYIYIDIRKRTCSLAHRRKLFLVGVCVCVCASSLDQA